MAKHFRKVHKSIDLQVRRKLIAYADGLEFGEQERIVIPNRGGIAISGINVLEGFECRVCEYLCSSTISMTEHCRKQHKKGTADSGRWDECSVQTFRPKNQGGYFIVARPQDEGTQGTNVIPFSKYLCTYIKNFYPSKSRRIVIVR